MIRLPVSLERTLKQLFPDAADREKFVTELIQDALDQKEEDGGIDAIGGTIHLFTDGGSRGNPGQAAIACVLLDPVEGKVLREHYERIGVGTNNVAEYRALIEGLKLARRYRPNRLICHLDSELVVRQLNGEYRVKMEALKPFFDEIKELTKEFPACEFVHVPREDNHHADALVNKALDEHPSPHYEKP
jgi:ribonuclease HI